MTPLGYRKEMAGCKVKADKRRAIYYTGPMLGTEGFHSHTSGRITAAALTLTVRSDRQEEEAAQILHQ